MLMRHSIVALLAIVIAAGTLTSRAQVVPAATKSQFSLTVGGLASAFQPDYYTAFTGSGYTTPVVGASPYRLYGFGTYVDVRFSRWVQIEGEARWLRYNQFDHIYQDNYLIGPRIPIHHFQFLHMTPYGKALIGYAKMGLGPTYTGGATYTVQNGQYTDIAFGGGVDFRLTKRFSARGDYEQQYYPKFPLGPETMHLLPYGASVGIGYKIF